MRLALSAALAALLFAMPAAADGPVAVHGAGATFPANLYDAWIDRFHRGNPDVRVSYDSVGSGEGVRRFSAGDVDFGASDRPMRDDELAALDHPTIHVPTTAGMVVIGYNTPGLGGRLRLSRETLGAIFAGKITSWSDPAIAADNPGYQFPKRDIAKITRRDASGTTYIFTSFLERASQTWRDSRYGIGTVLDFPGDMVAPGNEGVSARLAVTEWSLGYVEYSFAQQLGLGTAVIENRLGEFVAPSQSTGQAALAGSAEQLPEDGRLTVADPDNAPGAYPIIGYTWILVNPEMPDPVQREGVRRFLDFGLGAGQSEAAPLGYLPLPGPALERARAILSALD